MRFRSVDFCIPISECIKSPSLVSAMLRPPFCISSFTGFQEKIFSALQCAGAENIFIKSATGTGKSLISLVYIVTRFIDNHRSLSAVCTAQKYLKPSWLIVLPTLQLVNQFTAWSELIIPAKHMHTFKTWCLIGTPKSLLLDLIEEKWTSKYLEGILIDEADSILQPPSRYSPKKHGQKPSPGTCLLSAIVDLNTDSRIGSPGLPRLIVASATLNCLIRNHLFAIGYLKRGTKDSIVQLDNGPSNGIVGLPNADMKAFDKDALLPISQCKSNVRHLVYLTDYEEEGSVRSEMEKKATIMTLQSKATVVASLSMETRYQKSLLHVFVPKTVSKSEFVESVLKEYAEASLMNPSLPQMQISYFTEQKPIDSSKTTVLIGSSEDCRGMHFGDLSAVIIVGPIDSVASYIHMAGRVGRYSSISPQKPQDVISILSSDELENFHRLRKLSNETLQSLHRWSSE